MFVALGWLRLLNSVSNGEHLSTLRMAGASMQAIRGTIAGTLFLRAVEAGGAVTVRQALPVS